MQSPVSSTVSASTRHPWVMLAAALLVTVAALFIIIGRFAMTTDTSALISSDVAWRQHERAFDNAFPQLRDSMVIVIDGKTPELAEDGASRLADALTGDHGHFRNVRRPDGGDFLATEGLLYASVEEVRDTTAALVKAQPMLGPLAADPSLRGIANAVSAVLDGVDNGSASLSDIDTLMRNLTAAANDKLAGKPVTFSWQRLFAAGSGSKLAAPERRLLLVRPVLDFGSLTPGSAAADAVMGAANRLGLDAAHGVSVRLTGDVPLADQDFASLEENIGLVGAVMLAAMLITLWFATRSVRLVTAIMGTIVLGLIATLAIGLLAVGELNLISIAFIPLFVGLGVDFGIQICVRFKAERADGTPVPEALRRAAAAIGAPLTLAAGAIFLGFGAFLPTAYRGIAELGIISGIGMVIALGFSVTVLPALVTLLNPGPWKSSTGFTMLAPLDRLLERRRKLVLWAFVIAMLVSIALLPLVVFDFNPMDMRDPDAPAMQTLRDLAHDPDRTPQTISVLASDERAASRLAQRLGTLPAVRRVVWLDSFLPDNQPPKLAAIEDASMLLDFTINPFDVAPTPGDEAMVQALSELADKLAATAKMHPGPAANDALRLAGAFRHLSQGTPRQRAGLSAALVQPLGVTLDQIRNLLQAHPVSIATLPPDLVRDWRTPDGRYRLEVYPSGDPADNAALEHFRDAIGAITPDISGMPVVTQAGAATIASAFVEAGVIAFALVSILLLVVLRSLRETAFTLAPVVLSIFLTLGTCVLIGQPLNFANIIAFPLLFGVGVAFHIYFVMAWRSGTRDLLQSSLARAVLFSALATGTAFGSLWLSRHPGTASMGKILMISLIWTLICALVFEPALLGPPRERGEKR